MKKIIFTLLLLSTSLSSKAQFFEQDQNFVQVGYGLGLGYARLLNAYQAYDGYKFSGFGPVALSYERAVTDNIGIGVQLGYSSYGGTWNQSLGMTGTFEEKLNDIKPKFKTVYESVIDLNSKLIALENKLEELKLPSTPGRLPKWKGQ